MAYKIVKNARAWWGVRFAGVTEDGQPVTNEIEMRFIVHGEDEHAQLMAEAALLPHRTAAVANAIARVAIERVVPGDEAAAVLAELGEAPEGGGPATLAELYADFVPKLAIDWRGVAAENGEPLKFEAENIAAMCGVPNFFRAVLDAYKEVRAGQKEQRQGN